MNIEERLDKLETTVDALRKAMEKLQPLPTLTDEHVTQLLATVTDEYSPEVVRPIAKPKKKLIDMSRLPIGAMTNIGKVLEHTGSGGARCWNRGNYSYFAYHNLRIAPMPQWEVLQDGDVIPTGLKYEVSTPMVGVGKFVTIYKITGLMPGYTDDPSEAV